MNFNKLLIFAMFINMLLTGCDSCGIVNSDNNKKSSTEPDKNTETKSDSTKESNTDKIQLKSLSSYTDFEKTILHQDPTKKIYQLKVINQAAKECSAHNQRNLLFAMSMLSGDDKNFQDEYNRMNNKDYYDEMANESDCQIVEGFRKYPNINKYIEENSDFSIYLPAKSKDYLKEITSLNFTTKYRKISSDVFKDIEDDLTEKDIDAVNLLLTSYKLLPKVYEKNNVIPIDLTLHSTGNIQHATSLLINKTDDKEAELIFLDSLNWNFSDPYKPLYVPEYNRIINHIRNLYNDQDYREKAIIRYLYVKLKSSTNIFSTLNREYNTLYENIFTNNLYEKYKNSFCELIKPINEEKFNTINWDNKYESITKYNENIEKYRTIFKCNE